MPHIIPAQEDYVPEPTSDGDHQDYPSMEEFLKRPAAGVPEGEE